MGKKFVDFLHVDDKQRFTQQLVELQNPPSHTCTTQPLKAAEGIEQSACASSMNVMLVDSNGTAFESKIFFSSFRNLDDRYDYLIGICEQESREQVSVLESIGNVQNTPYSDAAILSSR